MTSGDQLRASQDRFVEIWGRMGSAWGISRTMAEVHALLYITGEAWCSDDLMDRLSISRGNASMSLRALEEWGIIERVRRPGERKEFFRAEQDPWVMFRSILRERMKREVDPLLGSLYEIRDQTGARSEGPSSAEVESHNARLDSMLGALETLSGLAGRFAGPAGGGLLAAASLLGVRRSVRGE